eukprot:TRINITY_DN3236_c0_g1_i4.p1 TRINITY_DN3236_c0_g1~~TRINITY_DN3236_c0_g1_i4.p1  ORF type:complete len:100 (+),score=14.34 TRINITY_DN3236_c0_g1_i4:154-453(+)
MKLDDDFEKTVPNEEKNVNYKVQVYGVGVPSGVSEQPTSHEETLLGARNRVQNVKNIIAEQQKFTTAHSPFVPFRPTHQPQEHLFKTTAESVRFIVVRD